MVTGRAARAGWLTALVALPFVAAACTSGGPAQVDLSQAAPGSGATATVTTTVTEVETRTATVTATVRSAVTVTATPTVTVTFLPRGTPTTSAGFDRNRAAADYAALVADVRALDGTSPLTGATASTRFEVMARHLLGLSANGTPPGLDPPSYQGRVASLRLFAEAASGEAQAGSPQAAARYAVIRQETANLLGLVNGALRTSYTLPAAPAR